MWYQLTEKGAFETSVFPTLHVHGNQQLQNKELNGVFRTDDSTEAVVNS
jgi:hypothetical protein